MGTVSIPSGTLCLISGVANRYICVLDRKSLEPAMATPLRVLFCFLCDAHLWCQVYMVTKPGNESFNRPL